MKKNNFSIIFIGTSSGKTSLKRFHSSLLVKSKSFNLLIDCGDGASKALLSQNISLNSIDGILFSHLHPDHSAGFASLIVQMKQLNRTKKLKIFCHKNLAETLRMFLYQSLVFSKRLGFELEFCKFEHGEAKVLSDDFNFTSRQNSHLDEYVGYLGKKKSGFACSSFLLALDKRKIFYTGDVGSSNDLKLFAGQKPDIMIAEVTHIQFESILNFIEEYNPGKVYLTHLSDDLEIKIKQKLSVLPKILREKIVLVFDGYSIKI